MWIKIRPLLAGPGGGLFVRSKRPGFITKTLDPAAKDGAIILPRWRMALTQSRSPPGAAFYAAPRALRALHGRRPILQLELSPTLMHAARNGSDQKGANRGRAMAIALEINFALWAMIGCEAKEVGELAQLF